MFNNFSVPKAVVILMLGFFSLAAGCEDIADPGPDVPDPTISPVDIFYP